MQTVIADHKNRRSSGSTLALYSLLAMGLLAMPDGPCAAQDAPTAGFYVAPLVQAARPDDDRSVDDDAAFTLATGFAVHPKWNLELNLFRGRFDGESGDDLTMNAAGLNALRVFRREAALSPYLLVGLGALEKDRALSGSSTNAYADAGAGLLATFRRAEDSSRSLSLRLDGRARYDDAKHGSRLDYFLGVGLQYAFGSRTSGPKPAQAATEVPAARPADADGDGVPNAGDRCSGTPPGRTVREDGCELGSDGVADSADACPGTRPGTRADGTGCPIATDIQLPVVRFDFDSVHLSPTAKASLDQAAEILRKHADVQVEVGGHTDNRGADAYNLALSQRRARAVRTYLIGKGVTNTLAARGYGAVQPLADNATEDGRVANRRVVLLIVAK